MIGPEDHTMKAIEISAPGGPEILRLTERPAPLPLAGEVVIAVTAAGINRPDIMQREGRYPPPPGVTDIPGLEVSGTIVALGGDDERGAPQSALGRVWRVGDTVLALVAGGGYAETVAVPGVQVLPLPAGVDFIQAAAMPENVFTVWTNVVTRGRLKAGEWLLVHGGSSGIGTTAIQMANARGATVIATAGTDAKCRACESLGARACINYRTMDFVEAVKAITRLRGVDVVLDMVGGEYAPRNLSCLATGGRLVQIATMGGANAQISLAAIMLKRLTITGSTLRGRAPREKGEIAADLEREIWPLVEQGRIRPVIDSTFPLARAADAHRRLEGGDVVGKVVLTNGV